VTYYVFDGVTWWLYSVNQSVEYGGFIKLGNHNFTGTGHKVQIFLANAQAKNKHISADAVMFVPTSSSDIKIKNAHYYTWEDLDAGGELDTDETVVLVNFVGGVRNYYVYTDADSDDVVDDGELFWVAENNIPGSLRPRDAASDLQNFANYVTYYRRRELAATAAVSTVINSSQGVQVGIYTINGTLKIPVKKIGVDGVDESVSLLNSLYAMVLPNSMTPLRSGLKTVGQYFHQNDGVDPSGLGSSPFASSADGGECQQCFAILMTDGYYNGSSPSVGNTDGPGDGNTAWDGPPYGDSYSDTLSDVAMYYYENDLSTGASGLANYVKTNDRDKAEHQHMVTYTVGFGVKGTLTLNPDYLETGVYPTWVNPDTDQKKIDDLMHAAINGRGLYLSAQNSRDLLNELLAVMKDIARYAGSSSSVSVNGDELYSMVDDNIVLFQSKYYSETWHGDVLAYDVGSDGQLVKPAKWSAAKELSLVPHDDRIIATYDGSATGLPFRWDDLTPYHKALLDTTWETDATNATNIVNYVRGDSSNEVNFGGTFRSRRWAVTDLDHPYDGSVFDSSPLGDIVHSSPIFRDGVLYAGGNDGMLHAFSAKDGKELFGYVPYLTFGNLKELVDVNFDHNFFVDLSPVIADVELNGNDRTILVGGLGGGGRGYYALNITDVTPSGAVYPANEIDLANMVLWEYPNWSTLNNEWDDLGYSYSRPAIVQTYDAAHPYVVIFGNGYDSPNKQAVLFVLDPETGTLIKRIQASSGSTCNGLSTPIATDVNHDYKVDYVYAGDLAGNMWKFDTRGDVSTWAVAYEDGGTSKPLFRTNYNSTSGETYQPITTRPDVRFHCDKDGYLVLFGTGMYLQETDFTNSDTQAIYGIWDYGDDADKGEYVGEMKDGAFAPNPQLPGAAAGNNFLLQQSVAATQLSSGVNYRVLTDYDANWATSIENPSNFTECGDFNDGSGESCDPNASGTMPDDPIRDVGWYFDLPESGERVVADVIAREDNLIAITYTPGDSMCTAGGTSWVLNLDACDGSRLNEAHFDVSGDGQIDDRDLLVIDPITGETASPTGVKFEGRLQPPAILILDGGREYLYLSSSRGSVELLLEKAPRMGVYYWNLFRP
jgi:type IV pilus assembly protein PilY1